VEVVSYFNFWMVRSLPFRMLSWTIRCCSSSMFSSSNLPTWYWSSMSSLRSSPVIFVDNSALERGESQKTEMRGGERERERETERDRDREAETETERERQRERQRQRDRERETERERQRERDRQTETDRQTDRQRERGGGERPEGLRILLVVPQSLLDVLFHRVVFRNCFSKLFTF
jgi:hypothetical protein